MVPVRVRVLADHVRQSSGGLPAVSERMKRSAVSPTSAAHALAQADGDPPSDASSAAESPRPSTRSTYIPGESALTLPISRRILSAGVMGGVASSLIYYSWWLEFGPQYGTWIVPLALAALTYTIMQIYAAWYLYVHIATPAPIAPPAGLAVDVFIPVYDEPYELVARSLAAAVAIRYPHKTYLLDDAGDPRFAALATRLGAGYLTREGNAHAKAGNVNAALAKTTGEFVAIFDVDHVPEPEFLDAALGHFTDREVG